MHNMIIRALFLLLLLARCSPSVSSFQLNTKLSISIQDDGVGSPELVSCDELYSRRNALSHAKSLLVGFGAMTVLPTKTTAAAPVTPKETDSLGVLVKRALRPKPLKILRQKLSQDFAVLLMRSSYNALDELDCVAMVGIAQWSLCMVGCGFIVYDGKLTRKSLCPTCENRISSNEIFS